MKEWFSQEPILFVLLTLIFGLCAWMSGQSCANSWRKSASVFMYAVLIAIAHRFLLYALKGAALLHPGGFLLSVAIFCAISFTAWRLTTVKKMIRQYPWLYRRSGLFSCKPRAQAESTPQDS